MRFGKRAVAFLMAGLMLLSVMGCKKKGKHRVGASSVEELVTKIITTINEDDGKFEDFADWFNRYAILPTRMPELLEHDCSFSQLLDVAEDAEKGVDYIKKHHKDFCRAWEEVAGNEISEGDISRLAELKEQADKKGDEELEERFQMWRDYGPYDSDFSENRVEERKNGNDIYGTYEVAGRTGWDFLVIYYYVDDGKYTCYEIQLLCGDAPEEMRTANEGNNETAAKEFDFVTVLEDEMCRWEYGGIDEFKPSANGNPGRTLSVLVMSVTNLSDEPIMVMTMSTTEDAALFSNDSAVYHWADEWDEKNDTVAPGETVIFYVYISTSRVRSMQMEELLEDVTVNFSAFPGDEKDLFHNYLIAMDGSGEVVVPERT